MIGRLRGIILEKTAPAGFTGNGGVGYEVHLPMTCFYELPDVGKGRSFSPFIVREDAQLLALTTSGRTLFKELIKTNGVGPKLALAIPFRHVGAAVCQCR